MDQTADRFLARADRFGDIVDGAGGRWEALTPCSPWTVADVVRHAIDTERSFFEQRGLPLPAEPEGADPAAAWRSHAAAAVEVLGREGVAQTAYDGYFGPTTIAETMADFYGWDLVVHGWDIARASGQEWSISDEEVARLSATADEWGDMLHSEGVCGPALEVATDASAQDRLLARLGRDPSWTAPAAAPAQG